MGPPRDKTGPPRDRTGGGVLIGRGADQVDGVLTADHVPDAVARNDHELILQEVEIESIRKMLARAADTGHSN